VIKCFYHALGKPVRLGGRLVERGSRVCRVYSDTSPDELIAWGIEHGIAARHVRLADLPHFLCYGHFLDRYCQTQPGRQRVVHRPEYQADVAAWRTRNGRWSVGTWRRWLYVHGPRLAGNLCGVCE